MTISEAKEWLSRIYRTEQQIMTMNEQIEVWQSLAQKMTSGVSAGGSSNISDSRMEKYCSKILDAQCEIEKQRADLIDIRREIESAINKLHDVTLRLLLQQRYLLCKPWDEIAEFMELSEEYIKRKLHKQALYEFTKILPK